MAERFRKNLENTRLSAVVSAAASILLFSQVATQARTTGIKGIGVDIREVGQIYRYKGDHIDTRSWNRGLIFPKSYVPDQVKGMEYAYHDWRPASEDSRTNDTISGIRSDETGVFLIAMPSGDASGAGWKRMSSGSDPDFFLEQAGRGKSKKPDPESPYWFYTLRYSHAGEWVSLPSDSLETDHSPFVFAEKGELRWENPPPLMGNAAVIALKNSSPVASTLANPGLLITPDGDYLAMISNSTHGVAIFKSTDKGLSWDVLESGFHVNVQSLFEHQGALYVIGRNTSGSGDTRIYKSTDEGITWENKAFSGKGGGDAPSHVDISGGRIWKAANAGPGPGFYSAPVDADLMEESSWTLSTGTYKKVTLNNGNRFGNGNEGSLLKMKDGTLINVGKSSIFRPDLGWRKGITSQQPDLENLARTSWDKDWAGAFLPQQGGKFTARYDPVSERYWTLVGGRNRGQINLYSATSSPGRIDDFEFCATILDSESNSFQGFNYPFMQIDGDDIVFVSRTAWDSPRGRSTRWHDGNLFTFHRITDFRKLVGSGNRLSNPGFEDALAGWYSSPVGAETNAQQGKRPHSGAASLVHRSDDGPYKVFTYKSVLSLVNGSYTLRAWVRSSGGQNNCEMGVLDYGGEPLRHSVPETSEYTLIEIPHINVTEGSCRIIFWSDAGADDWLEIDDVEFVRNKGLESGKSYQIIAKHSQKSLAAENAAITGETNVIQGSAATEWRVTDTGDGFCRITAIPGGKDLAVGGSSEDGSENVIRATRSEAGPLGKWKLLPAGEGYYQIVSRKSGKALNVAKESRDDGANVQLYPAGYARNQVWRFLPTD